MQLSDIVTLHLPAKTVWAPMAAAAAAEYAAAAGCEVAERQRIALAMEEAALYAVELGYGGEGDELRVQFARTAIGVQITICARGVPLDESMLPGFDPARLRAEWDTTGLGSFLIRTMVDNATFALTPEGERRITLLKNLDATSAAAPPAAAAGAQPRAKAQRTDQDDAPCVRLATPDDAESIARLALKSHDAVFFSEMIYYPQAVREAMERGEMVSVVAGAADSGTGGIRGHGALVRDEDSAVEEMTFGFVDRDYRGRHCAEAMIDALLDNARSRSVYAVVSLAVANHTYSQRGLHNKEFRECGLFLAAGPAAKVWRKGEEGEPERIANVAFIQRLGRMPDRRLHAPPRHREMIARIGRNTGVSYRFAEPDHRPCPGGASATRAEVTSFADMREGWALIQILAHGRDTVEQVNAQLRLYCSQNVPVTHLLLPLDDAATCDVIDAIESLGFFFAGVGPYSDDREQLILQYVNDVPVEYEAIQVYSEFGRELLEYIRSCDPRE